MDTFNEKINSALVNLPILATILTLFCPEGGVTNVVGLEQA